MLDGVLFDVEEDRRERSSVPNFASRTGRHPPCTLLIP